MAEAWLDELTHEESLRLLREHSVGRIAVVTNAAFEIDEIDPQHEQGWSVLVRGTLHHVDPDAADFRERFDPHPWLAVERDAWLVVQPFAISGRRLHAAYREWAFHLRGYL
jgi:hypothetical protein